MTSEGEFAMLQAGLQQFTFYEFFSGGGMARAGLGPHWRCLFANDIDVKKASVYQRNWGADELVVKDVASLHHSELPGQADLVWASFPCQDLSLAGNYAGLSGERSGAFWPFWRLIQSLIADGRAPKLITLENVCGALSSHGGRDFAAIGKALSDAGYLFGALVMDAVDFLPQSRPRLFIVAVNNSVSLAQQFVRSTPDDHWHTAALQHAANRLKGNAQRNWIWWNLPSPPPKTAGLASLIENSPQGVSWHSPEETARLLSMMSPLNQKKVEAAKSARQRMVGTLYKRTRLNEEGIRQQRAEVRFDGIAGCLRTPVGGSSRQVVLIVEGRKVKSRLLAPREAARLMGLPDSYVLPASYNEAYHLTGDGVVVPVVRHLATHLLEPLISSASSSSLEAA
jgi:DNA (cytosine-5)-methyltransferase 1